MWSLIFSHRLGSSVTPLSLIRTVIGMCWHDIDIVLLFFCAAPPYLLDGVGFCIMSSSPTCFAVLKGHVNMGVMHSPVLPRQLG